MPIPKIFQQKLKLFKYPAFIILHIAAVAGIVRIAYPEVELASLSMVILGLGLGWALITKYTVKEWLKRKKKKEMNNDEKT
jgi:hypothetical protein